MKNEFMIIMKFFFYIVFVCFGLAFLPQIFRFSEETNIVIWLAISLSGMSAVAFWYTKAVGVFGERAIKENSFKTDLLAIPFIVFPVITTVFILKLNLEFSLIILIQIVSAIFSAFVGSIVVNIFGKMKG